MTQQSLETLPIDIHYNKLLDWLVNRRHCTQQCQAILTAIRDKINKAKEATTQEAIKKNDIEDLLANPNLNYFQIKQLFELLKSTEIGATNFLGQYTSPAMKMWAEILKLYEKDGTYLVEIAQLIVRNVNYEVPAIKKQINKCQQTQKECMRKEKEYAANSADLHKQYVAACKQLGIEGKKIKTEMSELVKDLPSELNKFAESAKTLNDAVTFYDKFTDFISNNQISSENLKLLKYVLSKGNTTTYEWRTGKKPNKIVHQDILIDLTDESENTKDASDAIIDWGATEPADTINFDVSGIDFNLGDITVESGGVLAVDGDIVLENPDIDAIDWGAVGDVSTTESSSNIPSTESDIATGKDALSVIDNPETRNTFIDDLLELKAFLTQRLHELTHYKGDGSHMASAPSDIHMNVNKVTEMLSKVKDIIDKLTSVQLQHLLLIRDSPRYVDRLKDSLKHKLTLADKMMLSEKEMVATRNEAIQEEKELEPQLDQLKKQTKLLKKQLENEISKKYNDRKVNIIGEINTL
ncbi:CDK5 regulatory subunit-associated protein 3 [Biomphalaria glabrata]|uniref:CDK5 regulatory subunit-associated protein 3-like n=1 Tax=Biomphalaria glabrata TaxID=6526 RepID=A0A2C9L4H2_BIOGL|nr:CDK5 regulatory subunit-associated protein 3-like [Biomphalaria glabrata]KAI8767290.1 CDK5 regulatory subunit-associated protein 3 [Biomphalaria glabrata]